MNNSIHVIIPYKYGKQWVFDDTPKGLSREPFVSGADYIIDMLTQDIDNAEEDGFYLLFSAEPWPDSQYKFEWDRKQMNGNWYKSMELDLTGWLCPALLKYFDTPPPFIYVQVRGR